MNEREMFEKCCPSRNKRQGQGYDAPCDQRAWEAWQARARIAAEKIDHLQAALKEIRRKSERLDAQFYEIASRALDDTYFLGGGSPFSEDARRLDWLADPNNTIGNVQLPTVCVEANLDSLRGAIDMAMRMDKESE